MTPEQHSYDSGLPQTMDHGSRTIEFGLVSEPRTTLKIDVTPDLTVTVRAPVGKALEAVHDRVRRRAPWILRQLDYFAQFQPLPAPRQYVSGETHFYLGRQYRLKVEQADRASVKLIGRYLHVRVSDPDARDKIKERLELWCRQHARVIFTVRADQCFAKLRAAGVPVPEVKLRRMKNRWGSYVQPRTILLNSDLIKAPLYCIEYVIMHELCHLKHPHHGPEFWALLTRCMPDWQRRKDKLALAIL